MPRKTDLSKKMFRLAEQGHPRWIELRDLATQFDKAVEQFWTEPPLISAAELARKWARARRLFEKCGGHDEGT